MLNYIGSVFLTGLNFLAVVVKRFLYLIIETSDHFALENRKRGHLVNRQIGLNIRGRVEELLLNLSKIHDSINNVLKGVLIHYCFWYRGVRGAVYVMYVYVYLGAGPGNVICLLLMHTGFLHSD